MSKEHVRLIDANALKKRVITVSYTHLTLPKKSLV